MEMSPVQPVPALPETPQPDSATRARVALSGMADDRDLLRTAAELTRDLHQPDPWIYWPDCLGSAALAYGALVAAILVHSPWAMLGFGVVAGLGWMLRYSWPLQEWSPMEAFLPQKLLLFAVGMISLELWEALEARGKGKRR